MHRNSKTFIWKLHKSIVNVCVHVWTHISAWKGGEQFELVGWVALGGDEVKQDLEFTASQEPPFQKLTAWRPDAQLGDWLPALLFGLWWQGLLQWETDSLRKGQQNGNIMSKQSYLICISLTNHFINLLFIKHYCTA